MAALTGVHGFSTTLAHRFEITAKEPYKEAPNALGEYLCNKRNLRGSLQWDVAKSLSVSPWTYFSWELDRKKPSVRYMPRIIEFLGYDPWPAGDTIGDRLKAWRRALGLTERRAAAELGIDQGTLRRYESGEWKPKGQPLEAIQSLTTPAPS